jgi:hypothetical protein
MLLQNYLQTSRSLAQLSSLGDIPKSSVKKHVASNLLEITCDAESTSDQIYFAALEVVYPLAFV